MTDGTDRHARVSRTRPGTPMIGRYSTNQMDDFYAALSMGQVKPSGIMNYVQRLYIAERCPSGAHVVDVCCGRGLQLPVLYRYAPQIASYLGLDIAPGNLREARQRVDQLDLHHGGRPFDVRFTECDVAAPWPDAGPWDVVVYTSALEHLPPEEGMASLRRASAALAPGGRLYLSTPNTLGEQPRLLQHGVHIHEWNTDELRPVLELAGLHVEEITGLLPPSPEQAAAALTERFGDGARRWYERLQATVPAPFLDTVVAAALPDVALELLYVCVESPR